MTAETSISPPAVDSVGGTDPAGFPSARAILESTALLLGQGAALGREATTLMAETIRIGLGRSELEPRPGDHRFADAAWGTNPLFRRLAQTYLASCRAVDNLVETLEETDWVHADTARFATTILTTAAAPTNFFVANPAAMKLAFDTGGTSLVKGMKNWVTDLQSNGGMPSTSKKGQFVVGADLAVTPGAVVARDDVAELIQYTPVTEKVYERPTLIVPPPIGRFYFLDLAQGRSFVEYSINRGVQTFMLSWRNPTKEQAAWDIDTYAKRVLDAIDEVREVTGQERINVIGFCAGGILTTVALNHLAARGGEPVESAAFAVTMLDFAGRNPINTFGYAPVLSLASWNSRRKGVIDAKAMGSAFTWMRPNDLVWNYWVNNYLMGQDPPAFDILAWNADGTSLPATLHAQFLDIFRRNPLPQPGACEYLGEPLDLASIEIPTFVMGALNDHLTPWRGTYRTTELLSGETTYVLSNAGHIASLVNPPGNPRASYLTGSGAGSVDADAWRADAEKRSGTWWEAWADWTIQRAGAEVDARPELGSLNHPVLDAAPGLYVRNNLPA
jgi:polyhydroxyalkanoate synthase subunit PhaC